MKTKTKLHNRKRRHIRVKAKIKGTSDRPRVSIFRSNKNVFVQFIDDSVGKTILSNKVVISTNKKSISKKSDKAIKIGRVLAKQAQEAGIKEIVFDRGGYKYHGRVKALAEGLREGGLKF